MRVTRTDQGVEIFVDNKTEIYDAVIFACHANQVANILDDISPTESETLRKYHANNNTSHRNTPDKEGHFANTL